MGGPQNRRQQPVLPGEESIFRELRRQQIPLYVVSTEKLPQMQFIGGSNPFGYQIASRNLASNRGLQQHRNWPSLCGRHE